jgi:hypothetical protein
MQQLTQAQSYIFLVGAVLMVIGAGISLLGWWFYPYVYSVGALCYASMQLLQRYEGTNVTIRRLRRLMIVSDFLILLTGVLMFADFKNVFGISQIDYLQYVYHKWVVTLLIAALLQLYVTHRLDRELKKEA